MLRQHTFKLYISTLLQGGKQGKCGHTCKFCLSSGQIVPRNLVASQGITLLFLVSAIYRISKQMVNVGFYRYGLSHIALSLPVFSVKPSLIRRKSAAFFFQFIHREKLFSIQDLPDSCLCHTVLCKPCAMVLV